MDIFRIPGATLASLNEKELFDEIRLIIDACTNDILSRPDWDANIRIVDAVNSIRSEALLNELMFLVRRKLSSSKPKTVFLTISLVEALVKNGVERVYSAIGTDAFMKEIAKVARKYNGRSGADNMEVAELVLDVIQAWGEEFLSRRKRFPAFVTTYHNLRKEGLQFKPQYDANRVPIFTPAAGSAGDTSEDSAILNAAIAASLSSNNNGVNYSQSSARSHRPGRSNFEQSSTARAGSPSEETQQSMETSLGIFCEILIASTSSSAIRSNDTASEIAQQLRSLQDAMVAAIEYEINRDGENSEVLFKLNDDSQTLLAVYDGIIDGSRSVEEAHDLVFTLRGGPISHAEAVQKPAASFASTDEPNLLDFMDSGTSQPSNVWDTPVAAHLGPGVTMQPSSFTPVASSNAAFPTTFSDPFANDPDPFGPGTSSIDDLLSTPQSTPAPAASPIGDFFGTAIQTQPTAAIQQRKALVDPMQAFAFPPPSNGFSSSSISDPTGSMNTNMNGGFNSFQGLGSMNEQQQQQAYQPFKPDFGTSNLMPDLMDQFPYQQQQQQHQPFNNGSILNNNIPISYPATNQAMNGAFGAPYVHSPPPLPASPPPIAPQFDQRQHNPFDAF